MCLADFDAGIRAGVPDLYKLPLKLGVGAVVKRSVCPRECLIIQCFISLFLISQVPPAVNDMCKQNFAKNMLHNDNVGGGARNCADPIEKGRCL